MNHRIRGALKRMTRGPSRFAAIRAFVTVLPMVLLTAYWIGGEMALWGAAVVLPFLGLAIPKTSSDSRRARRDAARGVMDADSFGDLVENVRESATSPSYNSALFMIQVDDLQGIVDLYGPAAEDHVMDAISVRLRGMLRGEDMFARWNDRIFAACLNPGRRVDLEAAIQLAGRMDANAQEPVVLDGARIYLSVSIGFCLLSRAPGDSGTDWIDATRIALAESEKQGGGAIRAFSSDMQAARNARADLREEVTRALEKGEIVAWFQPQLSTETGQISGFEALARWKHPEQGILPPPAFLDAMEDAGLMGDLCNTMLAQSLDAMRRWDKARVGIPNVGVNFSVTELLTPNLCDHIKWELDRYDISPDRLSVEILETVMANSPEDIVVRNVNGLRDLGCRIDLDDFGTGHASLSAIRRFGVNRIKIDRSFVMKADRDTDQQKMVAAILTMAERLGVQTLAEGVETAGEHALLAQLGCDFVQGFGISRPMPFEDTLDWIANHQTKLIDAPEIPKNTAR